MTRRRAAAVAVVLACSACADLAPPGRRQQAIEGGVLAPNDGGVVAVVNFAGGQCSGALISRELVLTARHCVADTEGRDVEVICGDTPFEPPDSPGAIFVVPLPEITDDERDYHAVKAIHMPRDAGADLCGTDVVLLELARPLGDVEPLTPRVEEPVVPGEVYSAIGYGVDEAVQGAPSGVRKRLDEQTVSCSGAACALDDVRDNEWVGSGGPCRGDSGGPALDVDGRVIGVVSRGKSSCSEPVFGDVASRAEWLIGEAVGAASAARRQPPSWAPCSEQNPCPEPEPETEPDPAAPEPTESCATAPRAIPSGVIGMGWPLLAALALRARRRRLSRPH